MAWLPLVVGLSLTSANVAEAQEVRGYVAPTAVATVGAVLVPVGVPLAWSGAVLGISGCIGGVCAPSAEERQRAADRAAVGVVLLTVGITQVYGGLTMLGVGTVLARGALVDAGLGGTAWLGASGRGLEGWSSLGLTGVSLGLFLGANLVPALEDSDVVGPIAIGCAIGAYALGITQMIENSVAFRRRDDTVGVWLPVASGRWGGVRPGR